MYSIGEKEIYIVSSVPLSAYMYMYVHVCYIHLALDTSLFHFVVRSGKSCKVYMDLKKYSYVKFKAKKLGGDRFKSDDVLSILV